MVMALGEIPRRSARLKTAVVATLALLVLYSEMSAATTRAADKFIKRMHYFNYEFGITSCRLKPMKSYLITNFELRITSCRLKPMKSYLITNCELRVTSCRLKPMKSYLITNWSRTVLNHNRLRRTLFRNTTAPNS